MIHTPCIQPIYQYSTSLGNREMKYSVSVLKNFLKKSIEEFRWVFFCQFTLFSFIEIYKTEMYSVVFVVLLTVLCFFKLFF